MKLLFKTIIYSFLSFYIFSEETPLLTKKATTASNIEYFLDTNPANLQSIESIATWNQLFYSALSTNNKTTLAIPFSQIKTAIEVENDIKKTQWVPYSLASTIAIPFLKNYAIGVQTKILNNPFEWILRPHIGLISTFQFKNTVKYGFGIRTINLATSLNVNIAKKINIDTIRIGMSVLFFKYLWLSIVYSNSLELSNYLQNIKLAHGLQIFFTQYYILEYEIIHSDTIITHNIIGSTFLIPILKNQFNINVSYQIPQNRNQWIQPNISFLLYFKSPLFSTLATIKNQPIIKYNIEPKKYFTPNYDTINDSITFTLEQNIDLKIKYWNCIIKDTSHKTIASILPLLNEETSLPKTIFWNGSDYQNNVIANGTYSFSLILILENSDTKTIELGSITLDTTPPIFNILEDTTEIPIIDGATIEDLHIKVNEVSTDIQRYDLKIRAENGEIIYVKELSGGIDKITLSSLELEAISSQVKSFQLCISATDFAGNKSLENKTNYYFYENEDAVLKTSHSDFHFIHTNEVFKIYPKVFTKHKILTWEVHVIDNNSHQIFYKLYSNNEPPNTIIWDGRNKEDILIPPSEYSIRLKIILDNQNSIVSNLQSLVVLPDTIPSIYIHTYYADFTPNQDGINDHIPIFLEYKDKIPIQQYKLQITNSYNTIIFENNGNATLPTIFNWNGNSITSKSLESYHTYYITIFANTKNNIHIQSNTIAVTTGVIKKHIGNEFVKEHKVDNIELPSILFYFNSHIPLKSEIYKLDILSNYLIYNSIPTIYLYGYTDIYGSTDFNLYISEKRNQYIKWYLKKNGVQTNIITIAKGYQTPISHSKETYLYNRRVEITTHIKNDIY